uniref:Uncharacterized protein n=1 Tax=Globodera rostochiensis TaxID=31243 RepID=A0A914H2N5_GLORO
MYNLHQIHLPKPNKIFKNTQKQQKDKEKTTMGNTETSLAGFNSTVVELTSKNSNTGEELDWDKLLPINTGNDLFTALQPSDIRGLRDGQPNALSILCYKAVHVLARATQTNPTQKEHRKILNCTRLLTRLIPFLFEESEWRQFFWTNLPDNGTDGLNDSQKQLPLAKLLLTALSDLLFCPNFTIGLLEKNIHLENISKLDTCEHIWQSGVGFANKTPANAVYDVNRTELLRLLLVCFSEVIYTPTPEESKMRWITHFTSTENRHVLPLFTSLLNSVCAYDPVGLGMPYNYLLFVDSREPLVEVALQLLVVCLDRDSQPNSDKIGYVENYFVNYLSRIHREDDFEFMLKGFTRLLNNQLQTSYLPNSTKKVGLHQELLVLVWKCCEYNQKFLYYVLKSSDVLDILVPILFHLNESRTDPTRIGLIHMGVFLILLLSGERNFGVRLNKPFTSRGLIDVPIFTGTHADLLIIIFHKLITSGNHKLQSLFDCLLTIIVNVSPYLKSLSMVTANKLVHLVEAFSTPWFIFSSPTNHHLIFFLLEMFNNIIQYQFDGNSNLVYTIIRKRQSLKRGKKSGGDSKPNEETEHPMEHAEEGEESGDRAKPQQIEMKASSLAQTPAIGAMTTMEESAENKRMAEQNQAQKVQGIKEQHHHQHQQQQEKEENQAQKVQGIKEQHHHQHQQQQEKEENQAQKVQGIKEQHHHQHQQQQEKEENQAQKVQGIKEQHHHQHQQQQEKEEQVNVVCETEEEWAPTSEWVESWKKKLPLQTIMRVLQILVPQVEKICIDKGLTDESEILKFLQHGTLDISLGGRLLPKHRTADLVRQQCNPFRDSASLKECGKEKKKRQILNAWTNHILIIWPF